MKCSYHEGYGIALPAAHPFPMSKYPLLKNRLMADGVLTAPDLLEPEPIDLETVALVHTRDYLEKLESSALSVQEQRRLGLPWSQALWRRSRLAAGGTLLAARAALAYGFDDSSIALDNACLTERQLPIAIADGYVDTGHIKGNLRLRSLQHHR